MMPLHIIQPERHTPIRLIHPAYDWQTSGDFDDEPASPRYERSNKNRDAES